MITLTEARRTIAEKLSARAAETVPLAEALGRVLAVEIKADAAYPAADRSMMDGYAISADDDSQRFKVVGEIAAGSVPDFTLQRGECARIFTGAEMPAGASQVIMQEETDREGEWMRPRQRPRQLFVRKRGAEAEAGTVVLAPGARLGPADLAILAQVGVVNVPVIPAACVSHIATGDELIPPATTPVLRGKIRDTNSALVAGLLAQTGSRLIFQSRCGDDPARLAQWIAESHEADILLVSGGASVGDYDFGARVLTEAGFTIHFDKINLRPGKPLIFATRGEQSPQAAFVIPGNPVSHFVCFQVAIRLALEVLQGLPATAELNFVHAELGGIDLLKGDSRETYWPAQIAIESGRLVATPRRWSSSGDTFSLAGTNALLQVKADTAPGQLVPALLL